MIQSKCIVFSDVNVQSPLRAKRADARRMRTDELLDARVYNEEVVDHLLVDAAVRAANGTDRLAAVLLHVLQQMEAERVVDDGEALEADAARFGR